jgi:hypothetical protein
MKGLGKRCFLNFGGRPLATDELESLPPDLKMLVPMRPTLDRLESYLRFYFLMSHAASRSHTFLFDHWEVTWNTSLSRSLADTSRWSCDYRKVEMVRNFQCSPYMYVNGKDSLALGRWIADATPSTHYPFLYRDLLPRLESSPELHTRTIQPIDFQSLPTVIEDMFGVVVRKLNQSKGVPNPWLAGVDMGHFRD